MYIQADGRQLELPGVSAGQDAEPSCRWRCEGERGLHSLAALRALVLASPHYVERFDFILYHVNTKDVQNLDQSAAETKLQSAPSEYLR